MRIDKVLTYIQGEHCQGCFRTILCKALDPNNDWDIEHQISDNLLPGQHFVLRLRCIIPGIYIVVKVNLYLESYFTSQFSCRVENPYFDRVITEVKVIYHAESAEANLPEQVKKLLSGLEQFQTGPK